MFDRDPDWIPTEARLLQEAADRLEEFDPATQIEPRAAFLLAKWMRSYAWDVTRDARANDHPRVDGDAVALARHITGNDA